MAAASIFVMELSKTQYDLVTGPMQSYLNVGFGADITISELAAEIAKVVDYSGKIEFDLTKPDGPSQKCINSSKLNQLGWKPQHDLQSGLMKTYLDFCSL
jgi:GDP-L-fucose synthase